jgi:hypothetical protein
MLNSKLKFPAHRYGTHFLIDRLEEDKTVALGSSRLAVRLETPD